VSKLTRLKFWLFGNQLMLVMDGRITLHHKTRISLLPTGSLFVTRKDFGYFYSKLEGKVLQRGLTVGRNATISDGRDMVINEYEFLKGRINEDISS